jgi:hypothetical protein
MKRSVAAAMISAALILVLIQSSGMGDPADTEKRAVKRAVLDYCEAAYEMKPELLERSVHPDLHKFGFHRRSLEQPYRRIPMTYDQLVELAKVWNANGKFGKDALKEVKVFEVLDQTASAKLTGAWGIDYIHLAKYEGKWKIVQVLWQSHPTARP